MTPEQLGDLLVGSSAQEFFFFARQGPPFRILERNTFAQPTRLHGQGSPAQQPGKLPVGFGPQQPILFRCPDAHGTLRVHGLVPAQMPQAVAHNCERINNPGTNYMPRTRSRSCTFNALDILTKASNEMFARPRSTSLRYLGFKSAFSASFSWLTRACLRRARIVSPRI